MIVSLQAGAASISGTATCLDRSALPPDATLEVTVEDVSLADAPAKIIGRLVRMPAGQVPMLTMGAGSTVELQMQRVGGTPLPTTGGAVPPALATPGNVAAAMHGEGAAKPDRTLVNTYWKLVRCNGSPVTVVPNQREPHLILQMHGNRVVGSGGCNRLAGSYTLNGDFIGFRQVAATEMACAAGMEQEAAFLDALGQARSWRVHGDQLALLDAANRTMVEFVAVDLR